MLGALMGLLVYSMLYSKRNAKREKDGRLVLRVRPVFRYVSYLGLCLAAALPVTAHIPSLSPPPPSVAWGMSGFMLLVSLPLFLWAQYFVVTLKDHSLTKKTIFSESVFDLRDLVKKEGASNLFILFFKDKRKLKMTFLISGVQDLYKALPI